MTANLFALAFEVGIACLLVSLAGLRIAKIVLGHYRYPGHNVDPYSFMIPLVYLGFSMVWWSFAFNHATEMFL